MFRGREHQESLSVGSSPSWNRFSRRTVLLTWRKLFCPAFFFVEQDRASAFAQEWMRCRRSERPETLWSLNRSSPTDCSTVSLLHRASSGGAPQMKMADSSDGSSSGLAVRDSRFRTYFGHSSVHFSLGSLSPLLPCLSSETTGLKAPKVHFN